MFKWVTGPGETELSVAKDPKQALREASLQLVTAMVLQKENAATFKLTDLELNNVPVGSWKITVEKF